jgi:hypothetical protein
MPKPLQIPKSRIGSGPSTGSPLLTDGLRAAPRSFVRCLLVIHLVLNWSRTGQRYAGEP